MENVLEALEQEQAALDDMLSRAARLPDGTKVFRDGEGNVKTLDGTTVDDASAASIEWRGDEPSYEDVSAQKRRVDELQDAANNLRGIEAELGGIRDELTDNEEPPTSERVGELQGRIERLHKQAEDKLTVVAVQEMDIKNEKSVDFTVSDIRSIPSMPPKK